MRSSLIITLDVSACACSPRFRSSHRPVGTFTFFERTSIAIFGSGNLPPASSMAAHDAPVDVLLFVRRAPAAAVPALLFIISGIPLRKSLKLIPSAAAKSSRAKLCARPAA
jgi:hypothetical protein